MEDPSAPKQRVPVRALVLSLLALLVPVVAALAFPSELGNYAAMLWLCALVPAFLLAFYRGWQGVATALAVGMATLSLTQAAAIWYGRGVPQILFGIVVVYLAVSLGLGWIAEALHRQREFIENLAFTDILTRIPNRRQARLFLENRFAAGARGRPLSVVLFDLDHFKQYNDNYGHAAGDEALKAFAEVLVNTTRKSNLSARFGGEEFISVLADSEAEGAMIFAERVRASLQAVELPKGPITVSAGVASYHPGMQSPDELLAAADHALYQAKADGRNCVRIFGRPMLEDLLPRKVSSKTADGSGDSHDRRRFRGAAPEGGEATPEASIASDPSVREYPRKPEELGKSEPPVTLLPHRATDFGKGHSALVVTEEPAVRELLAGYLEKEGFEVSRATDGEEGARELAREFDVLVVDTLLQGRSGAALIAGARKRWPLLAIVSFSTEGEPLSMAQALQAGADAHLSRGFGLNDLQSHLVDLLTRRTRQLEAESKRVWATELLPELRQKLESAMDELVSAVEAREIGAEGRGLRASLFGREMARAYRELHPDSSLDPDLVSLGCRLLALGRAAVPAELLNRKGPLDPYELDMVRSASRHGADLLAALAFPPEVVNAVRWHGERWDRNSSPDSLGGKAIPIEARIAGVASALEALTRERAWDPAHEWDDAITEITRQMGRQFDPALSEALHTALPRIQEAVAELAGAEAPTRALPA